MEQKINTRKEPSLADLEAFERLLRESLGQGAILANPSSGGQAQAPRPSGAQAPHEPDPLAELARLMSQAQASARPVAAVGGQPAGFSAHSSPVSASQSASAQLGLTRQEANSPLGAGSTAPQSSQFTSSRPIPGMGNPSGGQMPGQAFQTQPAYPQPAQGQPFQAQPVSSQRYPAEAPSLDPLAAFEAELRRFDASRMSAVQAAAPAQASAVPAQGAQQAGFEFAAPVGAAQPRPRTQSALDASEARLAAQAAVAAQRALDPAGPGVQKKRGRYLWITMAFVGLGGLGYAASGMFSGSRGSKSGEVPVIAARPEPAKQKPTDPGGMPIPNQNSAVLSPRTFNEGKTGVGPNNTEQPVDLNQATKPDGTRVILPNPMGNSAQLPSAPGEPKRVTSVRVGPGGLPDSSAPTEAPAPSPSTMRVPQPGSASSTAGGASNYESVSAPKPPQRPTAMAVRSEPVAAQPALRAATPPVSVPAPPSPKAQAPAGTNPAPKATPARPANAPMSLSPMSLSPPGATNPAPRASGGGWSVQLASRPSEESARMAAEQLRSRHADALNGRAIGVVAGEANGQTVYRVRASGFDKAGAEAACTQIKASGGGCFATQ